MSRLTRDGTAEPVSRDQILRHARGQGNVYFPCSADHEQDWQPYPVDPYSAICDDHTYYPTTHHHTTQPPTHPPIRYECVFYHRCVCSIVKNGVYPGVFRTKRGRRSAVRRPNSSKTQSDASTLCARCLGTTPNRCFFFERGAWVNKARAFK